MDDKSEKYRKLSIASLVTGILAIVFLVSDMFVWEPISKLFRSPSGEEMIPAFIISSFLPSVLGLSIAAVVCGSIDLKRTIKGTYSKKGRGFDIAGIILGGIIILFALVFLVGEIIFPH